MTGSSTGVDADGEGTTPPPEVSVVVATRNRCHYLDAMLRTLADQVSDRRFEVVVVDNGSSDGTASLLEAWCASDRRFRTVREPRVGLSVAKNAGAAAAVGRVLLFTDDDVLLDRHWMSEMTAATDDGEARRVAGGKIVPTPSDLGPWPAWFDEVALPELGILDHGAEGLVRPPRYVWGASMAVPRRLFDEIGPWAESLGRRGDSRGTFEDVEYQDRARALGIDVWFTPAAVLRHRIDRRVVTPRRTLGMAFAHAATAERLRDGGVETRPLAVLALGVSACSAVAVMLLSVLAFAARPGRGLFRAGHVASRRAGEAVERFDPHGRARGRQPWRGRLGGRLRRVALASHRVLSDAEDLSSQRASPS